jgi:hypothetical protein
VDPSTRDRIRGRLITAAAVAVVGLIWIGQGTGLLDGSSFMVGDQRWAIAGVVALLIAVGLALSARRTSPRA